jgi:hypothetical protein
MNKATKIGIGGIFAAVLAGGIWLRFWCRHKYSGPFFRKNDGKKEAYAVCYKCSTEFDYDVVNRRVGREKKA